MSVTSWAPSADIKTLKQRADILRTIREFFHVRNVMEVETPSLSAASVTDIHLASFSTSFVGPGHAGGLPLYLQTSPEFAMKRLLAAGSGAIFQLCKAFRNEEAGSHHNPEFTMLEWYRPGFDEFALMNEMDELIQCILGVESATRITYQDVFTQVLGLDPLTASLEQLKALACEHGFADIAKNETKKDTLLQLLFCMKVEPTIGQTKPCFVYHFPASQAALAQICEHDNRVAGRFELYYKNMELANGFNELTNAKEQAKRFDEDNAYRAENGLNHVPMDTRLIGALEHGLPKCAGVAMGIDRLVMLATNKDKIKDVIAFDVDRA
ncbi:MULTISPECIES: elongation factor P--(R)-beta-lysine ligase [unclassified Pseudoalteromonas]|uniref:elongation factor P--(R)-beta-lysine ligase n=1 Tax=unclassified Pseudoalteromonas TaxID=194690 RepID=UPI00072FC73A|nr:MULTISPECIES: elongation factor P--(R)-beta-lysine ligase [unclassified Pseudoalteromonas]KTD99285.1 poxB regulator PoxA [Pseudoalteromonas sp. H71]TMN84934.1 elongation factor P--(R)-beta-lysine ligase [Pseudoalteromonas sp. S410]TMN88497.1 elongation factor P--(R)-beta-lysine ligase [Pseudoalteromonas sp. S408]TMN96835.1 elongation factor P--(R)-beta-lysine ligase [Pseudoalteromonas sp. S407]TMN98522.1 elongation factor P--(R)-beta-lysine ligase [Pseudoalteromonas sp. S409]